MENSLIGRVVDCLLFPAFLLSFFSPEVSTSKKGNIDKNDSSSNVDDYGVNSPDFHSP